MRDALKEPIEYALDSWLQLSIRLWNAFAILAEISDKTHAQYLLCTV